MDHITDFFEKLPSFLNFSGQRGSKYRISEKLNVNFFYTPEGAVKTPQKCPKTPQGSAHKVFPG